MNPLNKYKSYAQTNPHRAKLLLVIAALLVLLLISTLVAVMIRKDDSDVVKQQPPATVQQQEASITITPSGFVPAALIVKQGTKITWTNEDSAPHQLKANPHPTGESLPGLKSEILNHKQTYSYTADKTGSFSYHDRLNPSVNGTLDVKE